MEEKESEGKSGNGQLLMESDQRMRSWRGRWYRKLRKDSNVNLKLKIYCRVLLELMHEALKNIRFIEDVPEMLTQNS